MDTTTTQTGNIFEVGALFLGDVLAAIAHLNKRAARLCVAPLVCTVLATRGVLVELRIDGITPRLQGWALAARVEHTNDGNLIRSVPGLEINLTEYRNGSAKCDHCNLVRKRKDSFVVLHTDGRLMQVGRSCVKDFLGHGSIEALTWAGEIAETLTDALSESSDGFAGAGDYFELVTYLSWVAQSIRRFGWLSRSAAEWETRAATADDALGALDAHADQHKTGRKIKAPSAADKAHAKKAIEYVRADLIGDVNDYQHNLSVIIAQGYCTGRQAGYAASIVSYYDRAMSDEAARLARELAPASKHVGAVRERITFEATLTRSHTIEGTYGYTHIYSFIASCGAVLVWFASREQTIEVGETVALKGTVKEHGGYKGEAQTTLTRCKISRP